MNFSDYALALIALAFILLIAFRNRSAADKLALRFAREEADDTDESNPFHGDRIFIAHRRAALRPAMSEYLFVAANPESASVQTRENGQAVISLSRGNKTVRLLADESGQIRGIYNLKMTSSVPPCPAARQLVEG